MAQKIHNFKKIMKSDFHGKVLINLKKLSIIMNDNRLKMDKHKHNYFISFKNVMDQEKK